MLYIDDLDRCSPRQVVECCRPSTCCWRSTCSSWSWASTPDGSCTRCATSTGACSPPARRPPRRSNPAAPGADVGAQGVALSQQESDRLLLSTPQDYLEKIFNVPFVLPAMTPKGFDTMIRRLSEPEPEQQSTSPALERGGPSPDGSGPQPGADDTPTPPEPPISESPVAPPVEAGIRGRGGAAWRRRRPDAAHRAGTLDAGVAGSARALAARGQAPANLYRMLRSTKDLSDASRFLGDATRPGEFAAVALLLGYLTADPRLLGQILFTPADADTGVLGGLCHRDGSVSWTTVVGGLRPRQDGARWRNDVCACLSDADRADWELLLARGGRVASTVPLPTLTSFQTWAPHVARFSFVLAPATRDFTLR